MSVLVVVGPLKTLHLLVVRFTALVSILEHCVGGKTDLGCDYSRQYSNATDMGCIFIITARGEHVQARFSFALMPLRQQRHLHGIACPPDLLDAVI